MTNARSPGSILIIEDDRHIASLVQKYLDASGFRAIIACDGQSGLALARRHHPALVVLDLMLPKLDGWEVCRELRRLSDIPILILSARDEEIDRIVGLSLGADDYVVKPFSPRELVERVKAILRRARPGSHRIGAPMRQGGLVLDPEKHKVTLNGKTVPLTLSEYTLLHALMSTPGRTFTRDELLGWLYPRGEAVVDRVVDVHVGKLRHKIEADPAKPDLILTVRGVGYRLAEQTAE
jgi:DNA-binding response OmpR family regulator